MKTSKTLIYLAFISFSLLFMDSCSKSSKSSVMPISLTVEYLTNPLGLDIEKPRMSWTLEPTKESDFGQNQTAYRILVSMSESRLKDNVGDIWDSGWVESDKMQLIEYNGIPLESDKAYFWKVAVKDEKGVESKYSKISKWSTGLFSQDEWTAKWIGTGESYNPSEGPNKMYDPWFRKKFTLTEKPYKATLFVASIGFHEVYVNGNSSANSVIILSRYSYTFSFAGLRVFSYIAAGRPPVFQSRNGAPVLTK
jgi:alpha-L-rhamnosidase